MYQGGETVLFNESKTLYAQWGLQLTDLPWTHDNYWISNYRAAELFDKSRYTPNKSTYEFETKIADGSISYIFIDSENGKQRIRMTGNSAIQGKGAAWTKFDGEKWKYYEQETEEYYIARIKSFSFDYNIDYGDSFNAGGLMFNITETDTEISGLMLSLNGSQSSSKRSILWTGSSGSNAALWAFTYKKGNSIGNPSENKNNITDIKLIQQLTIGLQGNIKIDVTHTGYTISYNGNVIYEINDMSAINVRSLRYLGPIPIGKKEETIELELKPDLFGFFSDHYDHDCEKIGKFELNNIQVRINFIPSPT